MDIMELGAYLQNRRGFLSDGSRAAWEEMILATQRGPSGRYWWTECRYPFTPEFRDYVDTLIASGKG